MKRFLSLLAALSIAGCAVASKQERLADSITRAVIADDLSPVMNDFDPTIEGELTRVRVAHFSDELSAQGAYQGLKQTSASWCPQGALCFDVQFQSGRYLEMMKLASDGKVRYWWIRAARKQS
ncbi:MAG TPA: hypothetical protein VJP85_14055 [Candidatus Baltobacteraceae bacterium]|nr:hypothetical protein [Candidatus Baltobacteraceae bacterium]